MKNEIRKSRGAIKLGKDLIEIFFAIIFLLALIVPQSTAFWAPEGFYD